jgi:hypothetical protein
MRRSQIDLFVRRVGVSRGFDEALIQPSERPVTPAAKSWPMERGLCATLRCLAAVKAARPAVAIAPYGYSP